VENNETVRGLYLLEKGCKCCAGAPGQQMVRGGVDHEDFDEGRRKEDFGDFFGGDVDADDLRKEKGKRCWRMEMG
jgi:hypothetical protein